VSDYLLSISIGPVQDFIAAARRTRDLWFGSYVLSEISKAVANFLRDEGADLIFPAPSDARMLSPGSQFSVPNHILAIVPDGRNPKNLSERARQKALERWLEFAEGGGPGQHRRDHLE